MPAADEFSRSVFGAFAERVGQRSETMLALIKHESCSFEEWINVEFFDAARSLQGVSRCEPRPSYGGLTNAQASGFGDLLVVRGPDTVVCEVAIAHDRTGWKWIAKINGDGLKLNQLPMRAGLHRLQVVVVASSDPGPWAGKDWSTFAKGIRWDHGAPLRSNPDPIAAATGGRIEVRGWVDYETPQ